MFYTGVILREEIYIMQDSQQQQQFIGSTIGKLLRDSFGKGPESVYVATGSTFITMYLRNFLLSSERVLMEQGQEMTIHQIRSKLMQSLIPEMKAIVQHATGNRLREFYYDWNLHNKSGMFMGISSQPFKASETVNEEYAGKQILDQEIAKISQQMQKAPDDLYSCELNPRTLVVIRNGILVGIEKELIRLGLQDTLKTLKRNLEKSYFHNHSRFESILAKSVVDVFVDWDFDLDKSIITFILNPKKQE